LGLKPPKSVPRIKAEWTKARESTKSVPTNGAEGGAEAETEMIEDSDKRALAGSESERDGDGEGSGEQAGDGSGETFGEGERVGCGLQKH
jgi:hypothetical protein